MSCPRQLRLKSIAFSFFLWKIPGLNYQEIRCSSWNCFMQRILRLWKMMSMNHDVSFVQLATDVDTVDNVDPCATDARLLSQLLAPHTHCQSPHSHITLWSKCTQNEFETNSGSHSWQLVSDYKKCTSQFSLSPNLMSWMMCQTQLRAN